MEVCASKSGGMCACLCVCVCVCVCAFKREFEVEYIEGGIREALTLRDTQRYGQTV